MTMSECSDDVAYDADFLPRPELSQLPGEVKGRINALKNLQLNTIKAEAEYYREVQQLDIKFQAKFDEIHRKQAMVINGSHEPSGTEVQWDSQSRDEDVEANKMGVHPDYPEGVKGIPKFWLNVLKNANEDSLMGLVEPHDEKVLSHMKDLTVSLRTDGFTLHFHFEENIFFSNQVLSKDYTYSEGPEPECPLTYDGPEIVATKGCSIDWKEGKDITSLVDMIEMHGKTSEQEADSFFNFFNPPVLEEGDDKSVLAEDFEIGFAIKEKIIPRAVLYFAGEMDDCSDDDDSSEASDTDDGGDLSDGDGIGPAIESRSRTSRK